MRVWCLLAVPALLVLSAVTAQEDVAKKEVAKLQGTWKLVGVELGGITLPEEAFKGRQIRIEGEKISGVVKALLTYRVDATAKPKAIDLLSDKGKTPAKGIYELQGDTLTVCYPPQTSLDRPKSFDTAGTRYFCYTLKRE